MRSAGWCVRLSVDDGLLRLERRIAAQRRVAIDSRAIREHANPGAQRGFRSRRICHSKPRLENQIMRLGQAVRQAMIEAIELAGVQYGEAIALFTGDLASGQHDAVVLIAAANEAPTAIHRSCFSWIVELRQNLRSA